MTRVLGAVVLALLGSGVPALAQRAIANGHVASGTLSFDARATVGDFTGVTDSVTGVMTGGASVTAVRGWVEAPVRTLKTGNGRRDRDLNKSMESDRFPVIRFVLTGVEAPAGSGDSLEVTLVGQFIIHGITVDARLPATLVFDPAGTGLRVRSDFPMDLRDYRIGGLSKVLGILRMHPDITVHVDLRFEPDRPPGPAGSGDLRAAAAGAAVRP